MIVGPGNLYVKEAKHQLSTLVGIDGFAGPSDLLVVLGADAGERELRLVALDMLAQGEHGAGSLVVGVSPSAAVCEGLAVKLEEMIVERPTVGDAAFAVVEAPSPRAAIALANAFAPEHLQLFDEDASLLAGRIRTAGCVFAGRYGATAFGDYVAGSNHVLPTGGAGRFSGPLGPAAFRRRISTVEIPAAAAAALAPRVDALARAEGFPVHAESAMIRR